MHADFHGSWDTTTGVNSPLYDGPNDPEPGWSVDGCVKSWVSRGAPQEKLNIGLAFYGRSFKQAKELGVTHGGADYSNWNIDEGTPQYFVSHSSLKCRILSRGCTISLFSSPSFLFAKNFDSYPMKNIMDKIEDMTVVWDDQSATPYALTSDGGLVSYDDERSICLKTEYALKENLQGFVSSSEDLSCSYIMYILLLPFFAHLLSVMFDSSIRLFGSSREMSWPI